MDGGVLTSWPCSRKSLTQELRATAPASLHPPSRKGGRGLPARMHSPRDLHGSPGVSATVWGLQEPPGQGTRASCWGNGKDRIWLKALKAAPPVPAPACGHEAFRSDNSAHREPGECAGALRRVQLRAHQTVGSATAAVSLGVIAARISSRVKDLLQFRGARRSSSVVG